MHDGILKYGKRRLPFPSPSRYSSRAQQRIFSRFPLPPLKATGDEAGEMQSPLIFHWQSLVFKAIVTRVHALKIEKFQLSKCARSSKAKRLVATA